MVQITRRNVIGALLAALLTCGTAPATFGASLAAGDPPATESIAGVPVVLYAQDETLRVYVPVPIADPGSRLSAQIRPSSSITFHSQVIPMSCTRFGRAATGPETGGGWEAHMLMSTLARPHEDSLLSADKSQLDAPHPQ